MEPVCVGKPTFSRFIWFKLFQPRTKVPLFCRPGKILEKEVDNMSCSTELHSFLSFKISERAKQNHILKPSLLFR